jgi:hypothetical protein
MLERPRDCFQDLLDLGCEPEDLGIVTYNPITHRVDVSGSVWLDHKGLTRLSFAFGKVGGYFNCSGNRLTSLEGAPSKVGGYFNCSGNRLTSLEGAPSKVGGYFECSDNWLVSLEGAPTEVGGNFECFDNWLVSLEGAPREVGRNFECSIDGLQDVSALKGCKIKGALYFMGPTADKERVTQMLRAQGYEGRIR